MPASLCPGNHSCACDYATVPCHRANQSFLCLCHHACAIIPVPEASCLCHHACANVPVPGPLCLCHHASTILTVPLFFRAIVPEPVPSRPCHCSRATVPVPSCLCQISNTPPVQSMEWQGSPSPEINHAVNIASVANPLMVQPCWRRYRLYQRLLVADC